jgi:phosphoribosylaminoimidazole (AIR) synthetase
MYNVFPMVADDAAKNDADIVVVSAVMDAENLNHIESVYNANLKVGKEIAKRAKVAFTLQPEYVGQRISGYGKCPRNFNATAVSTIDEERLKNLPRPKAGHSLIAITNPNNPNSRSNGYSKLRAGCAEIFKKEFGKDWHKATYKGQNVGEMVAANSELFYPHVKELFRMGLISGFFHMSGGSHNGKLARPLAKQGLHCTMKDDYEIKDGDIFPIPLHERRVIEHYNMSPFDVFRTFPSGRDAYVTTTERNSWPAQMLLREKGYITRTVGKLEAAEAGKRGLTIKNGLCDINYLF